MASGVRPGPQGPVAHQTRKLAAIAAAAIATYSQCIRGAEARTADVAVGRAEGAAIDGVGSTTDARVGPARCDLSQRPLTSRTVRPPVEENDDARTAVA